MGRNDERKFRRVGMRKRIKGRQTEKQRKGMRRQR